MKLGTGFDQYVKYVINTIFEIFMRVFVWLKGLYKLMR